MRVEIPAEEQRLKEDEAGVPDGRRTASNGSSMRATIGCTEKRSAALSERVAPKTSERAVDCQTADRISPCPAALAHIPVYRPPLRPRRA